MRAARLGPVVLALLAAGCAGAPEPAPAGGSGDAEPAYRGGVTSEAWQRWADAQDAPGGAQPPTVSGGGPAGGRHPVLRLHEEDVLVLRASTRVATEHAGFRAWLDLPGGFAPVDAPRYDGPLPPEGVELRVRATAVGVGVWTIHGYAQSDEEGAPFPLGDVTLEVVE